MNYFFIDLIKKLYTKAKNLTVGSHELSSVYFKQVSATLILKSVSVVISFIYVPIVLGYLDQEKYGIWVTLTNIVNWIRVFDIGMGGGMRLKLSEAIAMNDIDRGNTHVSTTYGFIGGIFLVILIIFHIINPFLNWQTILNSTLISQFELSRLATITVSFIMIGLILRTINMVYLAHGNSIAESLIHLIISSVTLLLIWLVSQFGNKGNLILLATFVTGIPVLIYLIVTVYTFYFKFPHFRPSYKMINIKESGSLMKLSLQSFIMSITWIIVYGSIPFVVAHLFSPNEVTVFNIAFSMFNLPIMILSLLTNPIKPLVTLAYTRHDYEWIRLMLGKLMKMSLLTVSLAIIMIIFNQFIYHIWIGDKVTVPYILSASMGIFAILNMLQTPFSLIIIGTGKIKINVILSPINIGLFITLSLAFSRVLNDVIGVAIALAFTCLVPLIVYPFWLKKVLA